MLVPFIAYPLMLLRGCMCSNPRPKFHKVNYRNLVVKINPSLIKVSVFIRSQVPALNARNFIRRAVVVIATITFGIVNRALFDPNSAALGIL